MFEILLFLNLQTSMNVFDIHHVYLYNILGGRFFHPFVLSSIHPSKFLIPEEEDDGRGGGGDEWRHQQFIQMFSRLLIG
jgi:hypothetical protein